MIARRAEIAISATDYDAPTAAALLERLNGRVASRDAGLAGNVPCAEATVVVVMHDWMWGSSPRLADESAVIESRVASEGVDFLVVIALDDAPLPAWAADATCLNADARLEECVESILSACRRRGVEFAVSDSLPMDTDRASERASFFATHKAAAACSREFKRLVELVRKRASLLESADFQMSPGRCSVQYDNVALTISWIRGRADATAEGRLMIVEWEGIVRRGTRRVPERGVKVVAEPAVIRREHVLVADATREENWRWRREGYALASYEADALAAACIDSLAASHSARAVLA